MWTFTRSAQRESSSPPTQVPESPEKSSTSIAATTSWGSSWVSRGMAKCTSHIVGLTHGYAPPDFAPLRCPPPVLDGARMERPRDLCASNHHLLGRGACPLTLIYCAIRNENPSNTHSLLPSLETDFSSPRRTCCIAVTTLG